MVLSGLFYNRYQFLQTYIKTLIFILMFANFIICSVNFALADAKTATTANQTTTQSIAGQAAAQQTAAEQQAAQDAMSQIVPKVEISPNYFFSTIEAPNTEFVTPSFILKDYIVTLQHDNQVPQMDIMNIGVYKNYTVLQLIDNKANKVYLLLFRKNDENDIQMVDQISNIDTVMPNGSRLESTFYTSLSTLDTPSTIQDFDDDNIPEILVNPAKLYMQFYLQVSNNKLYVDTNPFLYKTQLDTQGIAESLVQESNNYLAGKEPIKTYITNVQQKQFEIRKKMADFTNDTIKLKQYIKSNSKNNILNFFSGLINKTQFQKEFTKNQQSFDEIYTLILNMRDLSNQLGVGEYFASELDKYMSTQSINDTAEKDEFIRYAKSYEDEMVDNIDNTIYVIQHINLITEYMKSNQNFALKKIREDNVSQQVTEFLRANNVTLELTNSPKPNFNTNSELPTTVE